MELRAGQKLKSAVSDVQMIVVKAPDGAVEVGCGGAPMLDDGDEAPAGATLDPDLAEGPLMGKRYADEGVGIELLCSRPGEGTVTVDGVPLAVKGAKPLPSSD